jgi:hypothetical protein
MFEVGVDLLTQSLLEDAMEEAIEETIVDGCLVGEHAEALFEAFGESVARDPLLVSRLQNIDL